MSNLEKKALVVLDNNANIQPRADLDIVFSSADYDSGILNFQVLKNKRPLILGDPNVIGRIILKHSDNSVVVQKMEIDSKVNEFQFAYQVPNDILQRPGKVEAQITIAEKGNSNVIVAQRKFSFKIQNSLFSSVNAETKTTYIVEFQELQQQINNTVVDIQDSIKNSQDYVTKIEEAKTLALSEISNKLQQSLTDFISTSDEKENAITTKGDKYIQDITNGGEDVNKAIKDFKDFMFDKDIVLNSQAENWQKYKMVEDDGTRKFLPKGTITSVLDLETGLYETVTNDDPETQGFPNIFNSSEYAEIDVTVGGNSRKQIKVLHSNQHRIFYRNLHTNGENDSGWLEQVLIGSDDVVVKQDSLQTQLSDLKQELKTYTDEKRKVLFDGSASDVGTTIGLTDDYTKYSVLFISGSYPGGTWETTSLVAIKSNIIVNVTNLIDVDASGGGHYEFILQKTDNKTLTIGLDNYMEITSNKGYTNANKFTVQRIEGWK